MSRIRARYISRRRVALICLVIGIIATRAFQGNEEPAGSGFLLHIASRVPGQAERFDSAVGRELRRYDIGGQVEEFSWRTGRELQRCLRDRENARRFILDHWRSKKRAYIAIDFLCADCMP